MRNFLKHAFYASTAMIIGGCAGGGGCGGCAGLTPLPGGFELEKRVENAGGVRLTDSGLAFLSDNIGTLAGSVLGGNGAGVTFPVPESQGTFNLLLDVNYTICPGGPDPGANPPKCVAEIDLANADVTLSPANPHNLTLSGTIPLRLQNLPFDSSLGGMTIALNGNNSCPGDNQTFANVGVNVNLSIEADEDPAHARFGYSKIKVVSVDINENDIEDAIKLNCGGFLGTIANLLKGLLIGQLLGGLSDTLVGTIEDQLCQQANPALSPSCPTGTNDVDGVCRYGTTADAECVSIMLGLDGNLNLGSFFAGFSPSTKGAVDILFAAGGHNARGNGLKWGDANPANGGVTLGLYGGAEPRPQSKCVPPAPSEPPMGIPIPQALFQNTVENWPAGLAGPHVGIGIAERFLNHFFTNIYNSGALCLGVSIDNPLLSSGTFGLLAPSMQDMGLQRESAPIAIQIRPGAPPTVELGNGTNLQTDPLLRIGLPKANFDFYVWSQDRFVRFMTATYDVDVPLNLTSTPEGLVPVLETIGLNNGGISNAPLLAEDPAVLAASIGDLVAGQVGSLIGAGLPAINLNDTLAGLGLNLIIPETIDGQGSPGLRKLTEGTDDYLGIFATLAIPSAMMSPFETSASLAEKRVERDGVTFGRMTAANAPVVKVSVDAVAPEGADVVFSYRVDDGLWSPPTRSRTLDVKSPLLRQQGRHVVQVRARDAADPYTLDATPAEVEVMIDAEAPTPKVTELENGSFRLSLDDFPRAGEGLVRYRLDDGAWTGWVEVEGALEFQAEGATTITVEAMDDQGNVGTSTSALRGKGIDGAGCGCTVVGEQRTGRDALAGLAGLGLLAAFARRRRSSKRGAEGASAESAEGAEAQEPAEAAPSIRSSQGSPKRSRSSRAMFGAVATLSLGASFAGCNCGSVATGGTGGAGGSGPYTCLPEDGCNPLQYGLIGSYSSVAVSGSDVWVAGYAEADWARNFSWGDLVVGKWDESTQSIDWKAIDGVPSDPPPDGTIFDLEGFRGGQTDPGEDVGLWASIAIDSAGVPAVAYYDRTNRALKYARLEGEAWTIQTVDSKVDSDFGRYAKLVFDGSTPVIAYQVQYLGDGGAVKSGVRLATGTGSSWTFDNVYTDEATPCRKRFCSAGTECFRDTGKCEQTTTGCADCGSGTKCVDRNGAPSCVDIFASSYLDTYPDATGLYIAMAQGPANTLGIAFYDRLKGNVYVAQKQGAAWTTTVVDGATADGTDNGDKGIGLSLAIDLAGDWHLAYVDGIDEALKYVKVTGGTTVGTPELVDDGFGIEGTTFSDGQHLVGDDSSIHVAQGGTIRIAYQDATAGTLRVATGTPGAGSTTWLVKPITQEGWAGAFSHLFEADGAVLVSSFWRKGGKDEVGGNVRVLSP